MIIHDLKVNGQWILSIQGSYLTWLDSYETNLILKAFEISENDHAGYFSESISFIGNYSEFQILPIWSTNTTYVSCSNINVGKFEFPIEYMNEMEAILQNASQVEVQLGSGHPDSNLDVLVNGEFCQKSAQSDSLTSIYFDCPNGLISSLEILSTTLISNIIIHHKGLHKDNGP